jgi:hypothetical protein
MTRLIRTDGRALLLALVAAVLPGAATALPPAENNQKVDAQGKYVFRDGSSTKLLEDYNIQTGADVRYDGLLDLGENRSLSIDLLGQSGEEQGYFDGVYQQLGGTTLLFGVQSWREYYDARTGRVPKTSNPNTLSGVPIIDLSIFDYYPFTNDSRYRFPLFGFGGGPPSVDWITPSVTLRQQFDSESWHDAYANVMYRSVDGSETLVKSGSTLPPGVLPTPGAGPNQANNFTFAGRKNVDYDTVGGYVGTRPSLGDIPWQSDASYHYNWLKNKTLEANFREEPEAITPTANQLENYQQETDLQVAQFDLAGGRNVNPGLYMFGGFLFDWAQSEPEPHQQVYTDGGNPSFPFPLDPVTRYTQGSEVTRYGANLTLGTVWQPAPSLTVSFNSRARGSTQDGHLREGRDESGLPDGSGDVGNIANHSDRDNIISTTRLRADWRAARALHVNANVLYRYRWDSIKTTRDFNLVAAEPDELENYDNTYNDVRAGISSKYRFKRGRYVEAGYEFRYRDMDTSIDAIQNQFILGDYQVWSHRPYVKASGRLFGNLRGELRFHYLWEQRNMDAPAVEPVVVPPGSGKTRWQGWAVTPMLFYTQETWNLFAQVGVGESALDVVEGGQQPLTEPYFNNFNYDAFTTTFTVGGGFSPSKTWGLNASYTFYNNWASVQNQGHNIFTSANFMFDDTWGTRVSFRYLRYNLFGTSVEDYQAYIPYLAITATF